MTLEIPEDTMKEIQRHGESAYPEEGVGLLLGRFAPDRKQVVSILPLDNQREESARHNRYLVEPEEFLLAENRAIELGLEVLGSFHSHPDHPNLPSEFDREWAWPAFSYLITSIRSGKAGESRAWRLAEDRSKFDEENIIVSPGAETSQEKR